MASNLATPGVYVEEKSSFGTSVVPVPTAVPAFVGYTSKALRGTKSLLNIPTRISNFGEFVELFGGAPATVFNISTSKVAANTVFDEKVRAINNNILYIINPL